VSKPYCYDHPHPAVATDLCVFSLDAEMRLVVLLIRRKQAPYVGQWALPGGFLKVDAENLEQCARRELLEETGVEAAHLEEFGTYSDPERDPREHVISVGHLTLISQTRVIAGTDAADADWIPIELDGGELRLNGPRARLAFDHKTILTDALQKLRQRIDEAPLTLAAMPARFTLAQLQAAYEAIKGRQLDKRNFRKWVLERGWFEETGEFQRGRQRPAMLYSAASNVS
jgi:8-oxo-dGTP diphosphatase